MKKSIIPILALLILAISCKKKSDTVVAATVYMSTSTNSTWNYELTNNIPATVITPFTTTSTNRDSTAAGRSYHVFTNSSGPNEYYAISGNDYYSFRKIDANFGGGSTEVLYLKDNLSVGATWAQSVAVTISGVPVTINLTNTVAEKGISKTVNGITYNDVIHITTTMAIPGLPPGSTITPDIQYYYAPKVGLISSKNKLTIAVTGFPAMNTDQSTILKASDIK